MAIPTSGRISLNNIHVAAGGTSGTECSLNDSDIRSLAYKSGSTQGGSFSEWYGTLGNNGLYHRGNGLLYDSYFDITWPLNCNIAGPNTYGNSMLAASRLSYMGVTGWRLPSLNPRIDYSNLYGNQIAGISQWSPYYTGQPNPYHSYDGSTDLGYNNQNSEMGRMFYVYLNGLPYANTAGELLDDYNGSGVKDLTLGDGVEIKGLRMWNESYTTGKPSEFWCKEMAGKGGLQKPGSDLTSAWTFEFNRGRHQVGYHQRVLLDHGCWPVHDGDIGHLVDTSKDVKLVATDFFTEVILSP